MLVKFLELRPPFVLICRGSARREIYGAHVSFRFAKVDFSSEGSHVDDDILDRPATATCLLFLFGGLGIEG